MDGHAPDKAPPPSAGARAHGSGSDETHQRVMAVCRDVLAPLVRADGGEMYFVKIAGDDVHLHLAGACSGCPGSSLTRDRILAPILTGVLPKARVVLTTGVRIPEGATKITD